MPTLADLLARQGSISAYHPTLGDKLQDYIGKGLRKVGVNDRTAKRFADKIANAAENLTPFGAATEAQQAKRAAHSGHYISAAGHSLGALLSAIPDGGAIAGKVAHAIIAPLYHGSPHAFEKFALEKIGTGEGAQAYGHGLYFAEHPEVARQYQSTVSLQHAGVDWGKDPASAAAYWIGMNKDRASAIRTFETMKKQHEAILDRAAKGLPLAHGAEINSRNEIAQANAAIEHIRNGTERKNLGHLYEVKLDANPEDFLNWDAPIGRQKVAETLGFSSRPEEAIHAEAERIMTAHPNGAWMKSPALKSRIDQLQAELDRQAPNLSGADFYRQTEPDNYLHTMLSSGNGSASRSQELLQQGIPGIRYLDQGSRGAGQGTSNYVVFDPSIIDILSRK